MNSMLLAKDFGVRFPERPSPTSPAAIHRGSVKVGPTVNEDDHRIVAAIAGDLKAKMSVVSGGGFSHESEHDLAFMVSEFLENGSSGAESRYSSDSDSGFADLHHLAERVSFWKHTVEQHESDLLSVVHSLILSIKEKELEVVGDGQCNISCIRQLLVKLLLFSGYDAALCLSRWQGVERIPGGDHEYIDVIINDKKGVAQRMIIDIDFQSHFEIARAVESYEAILSSLPVVYVGGLERLKQFLKVMVEATRCSLKLNSMPLPPWRSFPYLRAKWYSPYERKVNPDEFNGRSSSGLFDHEQCIAHLRRLKTSIWSEIDTDRFFKPSITSEKKHKVKLERRQTLPAQRKSGLKILRRGTTFI